MERTDAALERHDQQGRDRRRLACGAAVTNLVLAVRHLGWAVDVIWADGGEDPEVAATVLGTTPPTATGAQRYRAISPAVYGRWVVTEEDALALGRLLSLAARVFRGERVGQESVLILSTLSDDRYARSRIDAAMELAWLSAPSLGVAASVMTRPLQLPEVRTGLVEKLALPGVPQVVMRFGYPAVARPAERAQANV